MRGIGWFIAVMYALVCACPGLAADDAQSLAPNPPTATSPTPDIFPTPLIHPPPPAQPQTVEPSKPPSGYAQPPQPPVVIGPADAITITGDVRTEMEDGRPARSVVTGPVTVIYRNVTVTASEGGEVDYRTNVATFRGTVVFNMEGQQATMRSLTLNLRTRQWSGSGAITTIQPWFSQGYLRAPVFAQGTTIEGQGKRHIDVHGSEATTCNLPHPHYRFTSSAVIVYPDEKIIFKHASMYALGAKMFTVPRFVVPLRELERNPNLIPRTGQTLEEGYFLKTSYSYLGSRTQSGFVDLDVMTRKGVGEGLRNYWRSERSSGEAQLYHIYDNNIDQDTLTGRLAHTQLIGTFKAAVSTDFRSNSYLYAPDSKTMVNQFALTRDRPGANTALTYGQSINNYITRTSNTTAGLHHKQLFGSDTDLDAKFDYVGFSSNQPTRARLTSDVLFQQDKGRFDWHVSALKYTDLSDEAFVSGAGFGGFERLPEIGVSTDSRRLGKTLFGLPAMLKFTYGQYNELPANTDEGRAFLALDTPVTQYSLGRLWRLAAGAGYKQYAYTDGTAQYSFDTSAQLTRTLGPKSAFNLTYRFQRPNGFTPFRYDYIGKYNVLNASLDLRDSQTFRMSLLTGYNFLSNASAFPWQDVVLRVSIEPTRHFLFYTATTFDVNNSRWRTLINQFRFRAGQDFKLDIGTRYDTQAHKLATARFLIDTPLGRKTKLEGLAGYNGFTKSFDYRGIALTRDLHCWEATLAYIDQGGFYLNKGFTLNLRIKAFPIFREFGLGPFGQTQDTSVGQVY
jgi:hypothetical protein